MASENIHRFAASFLFVSGLFFGFIGAEIYRAVNDGLNSDNAPRDDRHFCTTYCNNVHGDLVEMHNTPRTSDNMPPLKPVCICAIGEPLPDVD